MRGFAAAALISWVCTIGIIGIYKRPTTHSLFCEPKERSHALLVRIYHVRQQDVTYIFKRDDGCSLLVYGPRFPVHQSGTRAEIAGRQQDIRTAFSSLPEYAQYLLDDGISLVIRNADIHIQSEGASLQDRIKLSLTHQIENVFGHPDGPILSAMVLGDTGMIDSDIKDAYRRSGIFHILSISGSHIAILVTLVALTIGRLPVPHMVQRILILVLLWTYVIGIGAPVSAVRAAIFWTLYMIAYKAGALIGLPTVILLTLATILTINPNSASSIGLQLSVAAVIGIAIALFVLRFVRTAFIARPLVSLMAMSIGAMGMTLPLTLYYFGNASFVGIFVNSITIPLFPGIAVCAAIAVALSFIVPPLGYLFAIPVHMGMQWISFVAQSAARIPYAFVEEMYISWWQVAAYYVIGGSIFIVWMRIKNISLRELWI